MMAKIIRLIKNKFFLISDKSGKLYTLDRDLNCNCKGFKRHSHCRHQQEVVDYIQTGATVDIIKRGVDSVIMEEKNE